VFFCNAIHLLSEKRSAFEDVGAVLAPGGIFACNSAFYTEANVEETSHFTRVWIRRAVRWLRQEHPEVRFSHEAKAAARQWLTLQEYVSLLTQSGFRRVETSQELVMLSLESLQGMCQN
jgi:hypothetical protein